ncbi:MAG TPA: hypothetical protein VG013_37130, partial [Gemmataceae bacterium]|nr:hypothetical protein [Gemmataceae bacterium]
MRCRLMMHREQPSGEGEQAKRRAFGERADQFIEQVQKAELTGDTEVYLVYLCVDAEGNWLRPFRTDLVTTTRVGTPKAKEAARDL